MDDEARRALRYVVPKRNRNGSIRWYWQRKGHKPKRLPDDVFGRIAKAKALNDAADYTTPPDRGTMAWAVREYRNSERFEGRAPATKKAYEQWLRKITERMGDVECRAVHRDVLAKWRANLPKKASTRGHAIAVMKGVLTVAYDLGEIRDAKPWEKFRAEVSAAAPRQQTWPDPVFLAALEKGPPDFRLPLMLLRETGQRPCDVAKLDWLQWDGRTLRTWQQQKTKAVVEVVATSRLRDALNEAQRAGGVLRATGQVCMRSSGKEWTARGLESAWRRLRGKLGVPHLQLRDLRRTFSTEADEADADLYDLAAVTGHSPETAPRMLRRTYSGRKRRQAERVTEAIEAARKRDAEEEL